MHMYNPFVQIQCVLQIMTEAETHRYGQTIYTDGKTGTDIV